MKRKRCRINTDSCQTGQRNKDTMNNRISSRMKVIAAATWKTEIYIANICN